MPKNPLDNLDVFYGELTPARATVYARLEGLENTDGLSLSGFVRGPRCFYSTTLLSNYPLLDAGAGPSLLAKALVPDPCYWSPETPNIYDVTVELRRGQDVIASEVRQIGFKPLGISGRFFTWEGRPWVMRGISSRSTTEIDVSTWREQSAVIAATRRISDQVLLRASERGVMVYSSLPDFDYLSPRDVADALRHIAKFPAVALVSNQWVFGDILRRAAPNVVLVEGNKTAGVVYGHATDANSLAESKLPVLMHRLLLQPQEIRVARAACDRLQSDLASYGQFAGYIV